MTKRKEKERMDLIRFPVLGLPAIRNKFIWLVKIFCKATRHLVHCDNYGLERITWRVYVTGGRAIGGMIRNKLWLINYFCRDVIATNHDVGLENSPDPNGDWIESKGLFEASLEMDGFRQGLLRDFGVRCREEPFEFLEQFDLGVRMCGQMVKDEAQSKGGLEMKEHIPSSHSITNYAKLS